MHCQVVCGFPDNRVSSIGIAGLLPRVFGWKCCWMLQPMDMGVPIKASALKFVRVTNENEAIPASAAGKAEIMICCIRTRPSKAVRGPAFKVSNPTLSAIFLVLHTEVLILCGGNSRLGVSNTSRAARKTKVGSYAQAVALTDWIRPRMYP